MWYIQLTQFLSLTHIKPPTFEGQVPVKFQECGIRESRGQMPIRKVELQVMTRQNIGSETVYCVSADANQGVIIYF